MKPEPPPTAAPARFSQPRVLVCVLVAIAALLRFTLAALGGQQAYPDEERFYRGVRLYLGILHGETTGLREIAAAPEHTLFSPVAAVAVAGQHLLAQATPFGDFRQPQNVEHTLWLGAAVLSLASALNIFWVHALARHAGATTSEAGWAAVLMTAASSGLLHARHLLPYPTALGFALAGLVVGLARPTLGRAAAAGFLAGIAYHIYNGYWFLVPTVWLAHTWWWQSAVQRHRLAGVAAAGAVFGVALPIAGGMAAGGSQYLAGLRAFSQTVTQGSFAEGWSLPWAYLWHAEGWLGAAVAALIVAAIARAFHRRDALPRHVVLWLGTLATMYGLLVLFSTGLQRFVVYGRTVVPMTPLLCLLGGWAAAHALSTRGAATIVAASAVLGLAALQMRPLFSLVFPRDFEVAVLRHYGNPKRALTFSGCVYIPLALPVTRPDLALVNAQSLYPLRAAVAPPRGATVLQLPHVLSHPVFQYEGHRPRERALLREDGVWMSLIRLSDPAHTPDHPPPELRFGPADRPSGR